MTHMSFMASCFRIQMQESITIGTQIATDVALNESSCFPVVVILTVNLFCSGLGRKEKCKTQL